MTGIEIKLLVEGKQKYVAIGGLESNSLDSKMVHWGYDVTDKDSEFGRLIHHCEATPNAQHQKLVELAEKFYPDKDYIIQINTKK